MTNQTTTNIPEICCIGHITLDKIVTPLFTKHMPGGTAYYFANALHKFDHSNFKLVTSLGESEMGTVDGLRNLGLDVDVIPSRKTVYFENKYGEDTNDRTQRVLEVADPFTVEKLKDIQGRIFHLGTLTADDFDLDAIRFLASRGKVSVDIQGYLRKVVDHNVVQVDYDLKREAMPYFSILKANEKEMEALTGSSNPREAAEILAGWGCPEVLLTLGDKGSLIYVNGEFIEIPAIPTRNVIDATGCGDTYMAGYLYLRSLGASYYDAGVFAAAMCTIKIEHSGPFCGTIDDVNRAISAAGFQPWSVESANSIRS